MYRQKLGQQGEKMIEKYLIEKGYEILKKNYRKKTGEIDIIARSPEKDEVVFIEVKTRSTASYGHPEEAVDQRKIRKIEKTALLWLYENKLSNQLWRIDIIALELKEKNKITHMKNVTV